jgi:hypothetical protein
MLDDLKNEVIDQLPGSVIAILVAFVGGFWIGILMRAWV